MKSKTRKAVSKKTRECEVCEFLFTPDPKKPCNHICVSCELTLMQCPVCVSDQIQAMQPPPNPNASSQPLNKDNLDEIVGSILRNQECSRQVNPEDGTINNKTPLRPKPTLQTQILRQCFLGIWDSTVRSILGAFGLRNSAATSIFAKNANNVMTRVGRQSGKSIFSKASSGNTSTWATTKLIGGLAAALICIQIFMKNSSK